MESKGNRKVIYTAIFGDYNGLIPEPEIPGFDFVCFTDNPDFKAKPWKIKFLDPPVKDDLTRSNRMIKILPHKFLPEYDLSIYIDGNFLIINDLNKLLSDLPEDVKMATFSHEFTIPDGRNCIYDEYNAILTLGEKESKILDDPQIMLKFINKLKSECYPEKNGLIKGGFLMRKHNDPNVIAVMEDWWYMVEHYSKRDQLSFNYVAWKNNFTYFTIPGDIRRGNPWVYWLGRHRKNWKSKLWKIQWKKKLGLIQFPKK